MYTNGKPEKALADFLEYMVSDDVQNGPVKGIRLSANYFNEGLNALMEQ